VIVESELVDIKTYALGAGINDGIRRRDMAFELGEIAVRMIVKTPCFVIGRAWYWLRLETRQWD
jgi:hypothetical protein